MPNGVKTFLVILTIPLILAISHDVYLNFFSDSNKLEKIQRLDVDPNKFKMSELGWVWITYSKNTYELARNSISKNNWQDFIAPALKMKTITISVAPIIAGLIFTIFTWMLGIWPFAHLNRFKKTKNQPSIYSKPKSEKIKYNRK